LKKRLLNFGLRKKVLFKYESLIGVFKLFYSGLYLVEPALPAGRVS